MPTNSDVKKMNKGGAGKKGGGNKTVSPYAPTPARRDATAVHGSSWGQKGFARTPSRKTKKPKKRKTKKASKSDPLRGGVIVDKPEV